jgi:hypothetical protein
MTLVQRILLLGFGLGFAGCTTPVPRPLEWAHIQLVTIDSTEIRLAKTWIEDREGKMTIVGLVVRQPGGARDTTVTHLDVTIFDAMGEVLHHSIEHFKPRQISTRLRPKAHARFQIEINPLPTETEVVKIQAHEALH